MIINLTEEKIMSKKLKKIRDTIEHLSDKDIDILLYLMKQNEDELPQQHIQHPQKEEPS